MRGFCANCEKEVDFNVVLRQETYPVKAEPITVEAHVCVCTECRQDVWMPEFDDNNLREAYNIYRKNHGLLLPEEIKKIRESYGLSQVAFARILGFGDKTIARYENGSIQDEAPNNLIMLVREPDNFMVLYRHNRYKLTKEEILQVEAKQYMLPAAMKYTMNPLSEYNFPFCENKGKVLSFSMREERIG